MSCSAEIERHDLFCQRCGSNLRLQRLSEAPKGFGQTNRKQLQQLCSVTREYLFLDIWKEEQDEFIVAQHHLLGVINEYVSDLEDERDYLQAKIKALNSISISAVVAKLTRSKEEKLKKYKNELKKVKNNLQLFLIQQQITFTTIERGHNNLDKLQALITDQKERWDHIEELIINNGNEVAIQRFSDLEKAVFNIKEELNEVAHTYRRLHIANQTFKSIVDDIKAMQSNPDRMISPVEMLTNTDTITGINVIELAVDRYYPSHIWVQIQRAIIYGQVLGDLKVEIRSAGTLFMKSLFDELLEYSVEDPFEEISYQQDDLQTSLEQKIRYTNEIVDIVENDYNSIQERIRDKFNDITILALQQVN